MQLAFLKIIDHQSLEAHVWYSLKFDYFPFRHILIFTNASIHHYKYNHPKRKFHSPYDCKIMNLQHLLNKGIT